MTEYPVKMLPIAEIVTDGVQTRKELRPNAVAEYANRIKAEKPMDPAIVFNDGDGKNWLACGHHRKAAYESLDRTEMPCEVRLGSKSNAIECGIRDNLRHCGEKLSRADRDHNIQLLLLLDHTKSDAWIAKLCNVSGKTVAARRKTLESTGEIPRLTERTGIDGRTRPLPNRAKLPELEVGLRYFASGEDCCAQIDPDPIAPGFHYMAIKCGNKFVFTTRSLPLAPLERFWATAGIVVDSWNSEPASHQAPWYVLTQEERWLIEEFKHLNFGNEEYDDESEADYIEKLESAGRIRSIATMLEAVA